MNTQPSIRKATKRLIDSVWTVTFILIDNKAYILNYSREDQDGYEHESTLPRCSIFEKEGRIVSEIVIHGEGRYEVGNPKHIFDYRS